VPRSADQKCKLLVLSRFLLERSDEEHPVSLKEMIAHLRANGIAAERKSIYTDLEALRLFGLDIITVRGKRTGYFIGSRDFELPELHLLVDAVQSSRFITAKKSEELIRKLAGLASIHEAKNLSRNVFVANRIKAMNESIYLNVDRISSAMEEDREIRFTYFEWNSQKEKVLRHGGEPYQISPIGLTWDNENYYLIGFDPAAGMLKHFRVDKMLQIEQAPDSRRGKDCDFDPALYARKVFGMYGGREESVTLACREALAGVFLDRFGKDLVLRKREDDFEVTIHVEISPVFLSWLIGFGDSVRILSPESVKEDLIGLAQKAIQSNSEAL